MARLGDICRFQSGGTPPKKEKSYFNGSIPWVTTVALNGTTIDATSAVEWITEKAIRASAAKIVPANSVLVGTRVGVGKAAINNVSMSTSQDIISLIDIDESLWSKNYICKFILAKSDLLNEQARGATIKGIKIEVLANLCLPSVTLEEQIAATKAIDKVDSLISLRKKQLQKLDDLVKSRFVEMFGDLANSNCTWDSCKLVDTCAKSEDIKCGPFGTQLNKDEYQSDGVPVWEIPQINSSFAIKPEHFLTEHKAKQLQAYSLLPRDIVMSRKGNVGKCALFPDDKQKGILHSDVLRIRVSEQKANPCFMMFQLHYSRDVLRQIEQVSTGAIMAGVNVTKLKDISVKLPPMELQRAFESIVVNVNNSKLTVQQGLDKLELLKQSLMQKHFG